MPRLTPLTPDSLNDDQRALYDRINGRDPGSRLAPDGSLVGPFDAFLRNPNTGHKMVDLGAAMRFKSTLPRPAIEVAILCVGRTWEAEFEWYAHVKMAREVGVDEHVIQSILNQEIPTFEDDIQAAVYHGAQEILTNRQLSNRAYETLKNLVGEDGLFDLFTLVGYYMTISTILNGFRVPLPDGAQNAFD